MFAKLCVLVAMTFGFSTLIQWMNTATQPRKTNWSKTQTGLLSIEFLPHYAHSGFVPTPPMTPVPLPRLCPGVAIYLQHLAPAPAHLTPANSEALPPHPNPVAAFDTVRCSA